MKTVKVQIVKRSDAKDSWYKDKIGSVYEVYDDGSKWWRLVEDIRKPAARVIDKNTAVVLSKCILS